MEALPGCLKSLPPQLLVIFQRCAQVRHQLVDPQRGDPDSFGGDGKAGSPMFRGSLGKRKPHGDHFFPGQDEIMEADQKGDQGQTKKSTPTKGSRHQEKKQKLTP